MRIYISVDIEGATGIVSFSQCGRPDGEHYDFAFARRMLTHDVNAAIRGARKGGATQVVVKDSHAGCKNLLIDELESDVELISGIGSGTMGMMEGIDASFDGAFLVGYHGMAGAQSGLMEHALAGGVHRFWLNGFEAGEIEISAAVAGTFGVPTLLVTSDDAGCDEAKGALPGVTTYSTKTGFGRYMGRLKHPSVTGPGIEDAAAKAISSARVVPTHGTAEPTTMRVAFRTVEEADTASTLEGTQRVDAYSVEWTRPDFLGAHRTAYNVFHLSMQGRRFGS
ncbi:M55 family metallopeptidase [Fimbriimonas ginsengisoli]|uniref:D-aminopeptidase n=1 Tax=Fimbriimonas ginsengisoli Gsoil 348 TaxID=661478 RepID=A0A068NSS6_FIMGI|nr:M55 family metallopeptidase [Fimbriimonas ginsengisoli]AIE86412.1 D-aminopeptidase [Fimbriimonas ginsengisoli Gsoil 348]